MRPQGLGQPTVHTVGENVCAVTNLYYPTPGFGSNAGIVFTPRAVVFVDAGMTIASARYLWQLAAERMHGPEELYLILTHEHADHTFGMRVLKERGAQVIAHVAARERLEGDNGRYVRAIVERGCQRGEWDPVRAEEILGDVILSAPDQVIDEDTVLCLGDEVHLLVTPGHTPSELSVYHPTSRTLFAGDTVYEGMPPSTKFTGPADWQVWIAQLERLGQMDIDLICPGHGNLCTKEQIHRQIEYLRSLL